MDIHNWMNLTGHEKLSLHAHNYTSMSFGRGFVKLHAVVINRDIDRCIKQIVTENCRREEKTGVEVSGGLERKDTCERHAWRSPNDVYNHYHKYIKSDPTNVGFGSAWIAMWSFNFHAIAPEDKRSAVLVTRSVDRLLHRQNPTCVPIARDPRARKVTRTPTGAYNVRALSQLFVNVNRLLEWARRRSFSKASRFTQIFSCVCVSRAGWHVFLRKIFHVLMKIEESIQRGSCLLVSSIRCNLLLFSIRNVNCRDSDICYIGVGRTPHKDPIPISITNKRTG